MQTLGRKMKIILSVLEIVAVTVLASFFIATSIEKQTVYGGSLFFLCVFAIATAAQIFFFRWNFKIAPIIVLSAVKALLVCVPSCFSTFLWLSLPFGYYIIDDVFIILTLIATTVTVVAEMYTALKIAVPKTEEAAPAPSKKESETIFASRMALLGRTTKNALTAAEVVTVIVIAAFVAVQFYMGFYAFIFYLAIYPFLTGLQASFVRRNEFDERVSVALSVVKWLFIGAPTLLYLIGVIGQWQYVPNIVNNISVIIMTVVITATVVFEAFAAMKIAGKIKSNTVTAE